MELTFKKKSIFYHVDPLFFYDKNNDGYGDLEGLLHKLEYLEFLNVDGVIIPDIFNQEKDILKPLEVSIFDKYGEMSSLFNITKKLSDNNKSFFVEIDLKNISNSKINNQSGIEKDTNLFIKNSKENLNESFWSSKKNINALKNVINFWIDHNVYNFIFYNFETVYGEADKMNSKTKDFLSEIYKITKDVSRKTSIGIKSSTYLPETINEIFSKHLGELCDFYVDNSYSLISTNKAFPLDILEEFEIKQLIQKINKIKIEQKNSHKYITCFGNKNIGRVLSRWINDQVFYNESAKSLLLLQHCLPFSSVNFYGEELGIQRSIIKNNNDYYDFYLNERKRKLEDTLKYSNENFFKSQQFLSPINSQIIFPWDSKKPNLGFSILKSPIRNNVLNAEQLNLREQYQKQDSVVHFFKLLATEAKNNSLDTKGKKFIKMKKGILIYNYKLADERYQIYINVFNKFGKIKFHKNAEVLVSSYFDKQYSNMNYQGLAPYESIIIKIKKSK